MKAVIIAESENIIEEFSQYYKENGYDIIVYRWLMKAMDNIEEIDPDLIFINAEEYPRHWKVLCQYVAGLNKNPKIVLYSSSVLNDEDKNKAKILNIDSVINSSEDLQEICTLEELCPTTTESEQEIESEPVIEVEPEKDFVHHEEVAQEIEIVQEIPKITPEIDVEQDNEIVQEIPEISPENEVVQDSEVEQEIKEVESENKTIQSEEIFEEEKKLNCKFLFTHPNSFVLITGEVKEFAIPKLVFIPDNIEDTKDLTVDTIINKCTLKIDNNIKTVNAKIIKNGNEIEFLI
ncbi:MAG: hypothetical protein IJ361_10070 [Spirochaetaceae bacterium]|nr:hypothetical protein [Spirochaetaceae bacterium]